MVRWAIARSILVGYLSGIVTDVPTPCLYHLLCCDEYRSLFDLDSTTEGLLTNAIVRTKLSRVLIDLYSLSWKDNHD